MLPYFYRWNATRLQRHSVGRTIKRALGHESLEPRAMMTATVTTDLASYAPGATADIFASGYQPGESVQFQVLHNDGAPNTGNGHTPWTVQDGSAADLDGLVDGNIHTSYFVDPDDSLHSSFDLTATGIASGLTAKTQFVGQIPNPGLVNACGLDMVLVLDVSSSIDATEYSNMVASFTAFINAFDPLENAQFALVAFDSGGVVVHGFTDDGSAIISAMATRPDPAGGNNTNWDVGLYLAHSLFAAQNAIGDRSTYGDLIVFASDGNPNTRGGHAASLGHSTSIQSTDEASAMAWAVEEADSAKADGIRIVTVGIGSDLNVNNLFPISGPNLGPPVAADTDVIVTSDFVQLEKDLDALADALCPATITGYKWNDLDADGVWDSGEPGIAGWTIYLDDDSDLSNGYIASTTTDADGKYTFDNGGQGLAHGIYYVSEQNVAGWTATFGTSANLVDASHEHHFDGHFETTEALNFGNTQGPVPRISIVKSVDANEDGTFNDSESVSEGGVGDQKVDYKFVITNTSPISDAVTISSLVDDKVGSLLAAFKAANGGSATLAPGASVTFYYNDYVVPVGNVGATFINTVTASGGDDQGKQTNIATDTATVTYANAAPAISIVKTVDANEDGTFNHGESVSEAGLGDQKVDYKYVITNTSPSTTDPVTISSLLDDKIGSLLASFTAANGGSATLAPGASVTFYVNDYVVPPGTAGSSYVNTVTASGTDDESSPTNTATDSATVTYSMGPVVVLANDKSNTSTSLVKVVNQVTGQVTAQFYAYEPNFRGGVRVTTGDMDGDGIPEIITAPGPGRAPEVRVFKQINPTTWTELTSFRTMAYASSFKGGVDVAVGDVNGDGKNDIVTTPTSGRTEVRVFYNNSPNVDPIPNTPSKQFYVFDKKFLGGADVAVADMVPGGKQEIVVGSGAGMRATVQVFTEAGAALDTVLPFANTYRGGVSLDVAPVKIDSPLHNDSIPDLIVAAGNTGGSKIEIWSGDTTDATDVLLAAFTTFGDVKSLNTPVHAAGVDTDNDGLVDRIVAVQGTDGTSDQIRNFTTSGVLVNSFGGYPAPWNIATMRGTPTPIAPFQPVVILPAAPVNTPAATPTTTTTSTSSSSTTTTKSTTTSVVDKILADLGLLTKKKK